MVVKQNKQSNLEHFFSDNGNSSKMSKLVDSENLA